MITNTRTCIADDIWRQDPLAPHTPTRYVPDRPCGYLYTSRATTGAGDLAKAGQGTGTVEKLEFGPGVTCS
jgi:hypothetical protein